LNGDHHLPAKTWFVEAIRDLVPAEVLSRPKRGFTPPVNEWIRALLEKYWSFVTDGYLIEENILLPSGSKSLHDECLNNGIGTHMAYKVMVLEMWYRRLFRGEQVS
jgi:asparagine synthase (glutamine-hydrolysing)